jgi:hypothetical protein
MSFLSRLLLRTVPACAVACAALAVFASGPAAHASTGDRAARRISGPGTLCGGVLWRLMTLSDPDRMKVNLHGEDTTISAISALHAPARIIPRRTTTYQRQVWKMRAVVDRYRIASNGEIILILYSIDTGQYMDAYMPAKQCLGPRARDRTGMIAARNAFTSRCPAVTPAWNLIGITVEIGGVGFWNPNKTTRGALANGAELRPVTNLQIVTGCGIGQ